MIFPWKGKWYFIATNDNLDDIGLYVRVADHVGGLFEEGITEHLILGVDEEKGFVQTFWAPEFHVIGGELYILFAIGGKVWGPQCWLMRLKKDGDITKACDWEEPVRVKRKDGGWLAQDGITLDMTYLKAGGSSYMVWSYRKGIGTAADTGSMLYIATVDESKPWILTSDPVLLSRPLYGWENVSHTINNEGPHGFVSGERVFLTYSGGAAIPMCWGCFRPGLRMICLRYPTGRRANLPCFRFIPWRTSTGRGTIPSLRMRWET